MTGAEWEEVSRHRIPTLAYAEPSAQLITEVLASDLPANQFGYFLASQTQDFVQQPGGSQGNLCLGGTLGRFTESLMTTGALGELSYQVPIDALPSPLPTGVRPGETWNFQTWYRDVGATSNFTQVLSVTFE
ncbi:MAG: hypothetical protein O2816_16535 [Planctomycetota bacterium]|nr:hypothetical protein [Planctomycetota bacterium]